nr:hypothetical protein [Phocaeicola vulgatus]
MGDNSKAYGNNSKGYGDRIHPFKTADSGKRKGLCNRNECDMLLLRQQKDRTV